MYRHIEVFGLELIGHLSKLLQGVLPLRLFESKSFRRLRHLQKSTSLFKYYNSSIYLHFYSCGLKKSNILAQVSLIFTHYSCQIFRKKNATITSCMYINLFSFQYTYTIWPWRHNCFIIMIHSVHMSETILTLFCFYWQSLFIFLLEKYKAKTLYLISF